MWRKINLKLISFNLISGAIIAMICLNISNYNGIFLSLIVSLFIFYRYLKTKNSIYLIILFGLIIRLLFIFLDYNFNLIPYEWDTGQYHGTAIQIKENILQGKGLFYHVYESNSVSSYSLFVAIFYIIFGSFELNIRIINAFLGVLIAKQSYDIALMTNLKENSAKWVGILVTLWPTFILFTSINMRESVIIFLTLNLIKRIFKFSNGNMLNSCLLITDFILIGYLRKQYVPLYLFILVMYLLIKEIRKRGILFKGIASILLLVLVVGSIVTLEMNTFDQFSFSYFANEMEYRTSGGAAYLEWMDYNGMIDVLKYLPLRMIYFVFSPFIWDVNFSNPFMVLALIESTLLMLFSLFGLKSFFPSKVLSNPRRLFLVIFMVIGFAANAIITGNFGTAIRHRMSYIIMLFIFASIYLERIKIKVS